MVVIGRPRAEPGESDAVNGRGAGPLGGHEESGSEGEAMDAAEQVVKLSCDVNRSMSSAHLPRCGPAGT